MTSNDWFEVLTGHLRARLNVRFLTTGIGALIRALKGNEADVQTHWLESPLGKVPVAQPWPECYIEVARGATTVLTWPKGTQGYEYPVVLGFLEGALTKLKIGAGETAPVARKGDAVKVTIPITADGGVVLAELATALLATGAFMPSGTPPTPTPPSAPIDFHGEVTEGASKVEVE